MSQASDVAPSVHLTPAQKLQVCLFREDNPNISHRKLIEYCQLHFQKAPSTSAMQRILRNPERWLDSARQNIHTRRYRGPKWPQLEAELRDWWVAVTAEQASFSSA